MTTFPETHRDLLEAAVGVLATNGEDGFPQVTALWFLFDEGEIKFSLNTSRQKLKNLQADPRCTFFVLDTANPYRTLEVRAQAEIRPDDDYAFAGKVGAKYGGVDFGEIDGPGESRVAVALEVERVNVYGE